MNNDMETCRSPPGFVNNKSCQTNLISFCNKVTGILDRGETSGVIYLDSSKVFSSLSSYISSNLEEQGLEEGEQQIHAKINKNVKREGRMDWSSVRVCPVLISVQYFL